MNNLSVKERPILFQGAMVRALLDGSKTQTRRLVKPQPNNDPKKHHPIKPYNTSLGQWNWVLAATGHGCGDPFDCPYGQPGDRLWVREAWARTYVAQASMEWVVYREGDNRTDYGGPWKPSIHMFRADSRILLEIASVRVERLQDISEADATAEGVREWARGACAAGNPHGYTDVGYYSLLWEQINGVGSWDANPWVWVVEFKRVQP